MNLHQVGPDGLSLVRHDLCRPLRSLSTWTCRDVRQERQGMTESASICRTYTIADFIEKPSRGGP